jgi:nitrate/nitrite transporter NarK
MEVLIVVAAVFVLFLVINWIFKLVKTTVKTLLLAAFVLIALYVLFGIGPAAIWEQIQTWWQGQ